QLETLRGESERAERDGDLAKAAELRYGRIPEVEKKLDAAATTARAHETQMLKEEVGPDDIADVVSAWTGIPAGRLLEGETAKLLRMEDELGRRVVGQRKAVQAVSDAVRRTRAGVADPNRPTGSFLFLGPTGVGKTELAKALAEFMFGSEDALIQLDMSEFMERHTVSRLVGAPPGYVGYEEAGQLTEAIRRRPYSVVCFDEVEKAHPEAFNMLLQIMEDGHLSDAKGHKVDFRNTIIVMTSNIGSELILEGSETPAYLEPKIRQLLSAHFRPEFLNRIDEIIIFHCLNREQLRAIVQLQIQQLQQLLAEQQVTLEVTPAAVDYLVTAGYDPAYGARPLRRAIQRELENPLADFLLSQPPSGPLKIRVDMQGQQLALVRCL
ncbi:MAG: AAA family ATPase, partial [Gloeomargarita sp. GMQP_bins_5]